MVLANTYYVDGAFTLKKGDIRIENGVITEIGKNLVSDEVMDCTGKYILPGFIDTHFHGAGGVKVSDENPDFDKMTTYLATQGVTSIALSTAVGTYSSLLKQVENVARYKGNDRGAKMLAINLEGPYISVHYKGAMNASHMIPPSVSQFEELCEKSNYMIKMITIAPELEGALTLIEYAVSKNIRVFLGHTGATYEQAIRAIEAGATGMTHTFNASVGLHHRNPGVLGAVLTDDRVSCEAICDYVHLHPAIIKLIYKAKGRDKINMVSDSVFVAGTDFDAFIETDGVTRYIKDKKITLANGTIAGSAMTLLDGVQNLLRAGYPVQDVAKMASYNPAKTLGVEAKVGSIEVGKCADIIVLDGTFALERTYINGKCVYSA